MHCNTLHYRTFRHGAYLSATSKRGFTLVELSIVLVIIGLIIGGILTGQYLIDTAAARAQISQMEKYQTAVRTFQVKYGFLPGDVPNPQATIFGFLSRGSHAGEGDGNGILEGNCTDANGANSGFDQGCGELATFWVDLSTAGFIDTSITYNGAGYPNPTSYTSNPTLTSTPGIKNWLPQARLNNSLFIYLYSIHGTNYFSVSTATSIPWNIGTTTNPGITVQQAYNIDSKIDDGLPQSGSVTACYENFYILGEGISWAAGWAPGGDWQGFGSANCVPSTGAAPYFVQNCYDNNNSAGKTQQYSLAQNASMLNCALSFKFQ